MPREDVSDFVLPSVDDILLNSIPEKSVEQYKKSWQRFLSHMKINNETIPSEEDYLRYLDYLRRERKLKGSTLWTIYSHLNGVHQRRFGE